MRIPVMFNDNINIWVKVVFFEQEFEAQDHVKWCISALECSNVELFYNGVRSLVTLMLTIRSGFAKDFVFP
jgi:hypothetical protein